MSRDAAITAFLRSHGYGAARVAPLAQDASFRRYLRISGGPLPAVLMDAPPPEDVRPFLRMQAHLAGIGLSVPAILAADADAGLLLEEDLGDDLLSSLLDTLPIPSSHVIPGLVPGLNRRTGLRSTTPAAVDPRHKAESDVGGRALGDVGSEALDDVRDGAEEAVSGGDVGDVRDGALGDGTGEALDDDSGGALGDGTGEALDDDSGAALGDVGGGALEDVRSGFEDDVGRGFGDEVGAAGRGNATALFDAAVDALVPLQRAAPPADLPTWGPTEMRDTALGTLFDWWWPSVYGSVAPDAARRDVADALAAILAPLATGPRCMVHRDFFAGNLLWLPDRPPPRRVGIIDFQGAAIGHPAYDLVSLVQDARRDIPAAIQQHATARYLAARPDLDPVAFRDAFAVCAAQRHLRVACQWVRLARRDHRPHYLAYGPRTWRLLGQALTHPTVAPLAAALDRWIPHAARGNPPGEPPA